MGRSIFLLETGMDLERETGRIPMLTMKASHSVDAKQDGYRAAPAGALARLPLRS